jgi:hypothetical protein
MTAASLTLFPLLAGPLRSARVLAIVPGAVYLQLDPVDGAEPGAGAAGVPAAGANRAGGGTTVLPGDGVDRAGAVIALLDQDAVRLPFGLVLPAAAADLRPVLVGGTPVSRGTITMGWGALRLAGIRWPVLEWWNPGVPTLALPPPALPTSATSTSATSTSAAPTSAFSTSAVPPPTDPGVADLGPDDGFELPALPLELAAGVSALASGEAERVVRLLTGIGPGPTPMGDGVLCGALAALACWAPDSPARRNLAEAVAAAADRTTTISAALLQAAVAGTVIPELAALLTAIGTGSRSDVARTIDGLARPTAVSGAAMAVGAVQQFRQLSRTARTTA